MGPGAGERKGPVVLLSRCRRRVPALVAQLERERYQVLQADQLQQAEALAAARAPTVLLIDWPPGEEPPLPEVVHRLRPGPDGGRLVVIAEGEAAAGIRGGTAVRAVVSAELDPDELCDAIWRAHQESLDARARARR